MSINGTGLAENKNRPAKRVPARMNTSKFVRLLAGVPIGVGGRECLPLFRQIFHRENRGHRTNRYASSAVNTFGRIDVKLSFALVLRFIFSRVDTIDRADIHASAIFRADTRLGNHVSHSTVSFIRYHPPPSLPENSPTKCTRRALDSQLQLSSTQLPFPYIQNGIVCEAVLD